MPVTITVSETSNRTSQVIYIYIYIYIYKHAQASGRLCGRVVRVLGYRSRDPGSILGTTRFSEK
jgi:hypothetical protein